MWSLVDEAVTAVIIVVCFRLPFETVMAISGLSLVDEAAVALSPIV